LGAALFCISGKSSFNIAISLLIFWRPLRSVLLWRSFRSSSERLRLERRLASNSPGRGLFTSVVGVETPESQGDSISLNAREELEDERRGERVGLFTGAMDPPTTPTEMFATGCPTSSILSHSTDMIEGRKMEQLTVRNKRG